MMSISMFLAFNSLDLADQILQLKKTNKNKMKTYQNGKVTVRNFLRCVIFYFQVVPVSSMAGCYQIDIG